MAEPIRRGRVPLPSSQTAISSPRVESTAKSHPAARQFHEKGDKIMMLSWGLHHRPKPLVLNGVMQPIDIADSLDRFHWEALRALGAPSPDPSRLNEAVLKQLLGSDLLELEFLEERQTPSAASSVLTVMKIRMSEPTVQKAARMSWVWPVK